MKQSKVIFNITRFNGTRVLCQIRPQAPGGRRRRLFPVSSSRVFRKLAFKRLIDRNSFGD